MTGYIKTRDAFELYRSYDAISWDLPVASYQAATGNVVLRGAVPAAAKDMWLLLDGSIWTIQRVEPKNGLTTLTIAPAIDAFDRPLLMQPAAETVDLFIARALEAEFQLQPDAEFALPYLQIGVSGAAPFIKPEVSDAGLYSLPDYVRSVQDSVRVDFAVSGAAMLVNVAPALLTTHSVIMDGVTELKQQTYSRQFTAKVTVVQGTGSTVYYVDADGAISSDPPANRPKGEWRVIEARDNMNAMDAAKEVFAENVAANKIAFASPDRYSLGDIIRTRLDGAAAALKVTAIRKTSSDSRWLYECGELPTSLSERLKAAESIEALGGIPVSGGAVKGNLGVRGRLTADGGMYVGDALVLSSASYGYELPVTDLQEGRLFFLLEE